MGIYSLQRPAAAQLASRRFDVVVIGGGITGAGVAQDAASRGLSVLLLEKGDFASGTSSKSTKLIHGGLRYLQNLQMGVVMESLHERQLQMQLAPHMVWSLPFVVPTYRDQRLKNTKLGLGLWVYDLLAGFKNHRFHRRISAVQVAELCPGVRTEGLTGGFLFSDCRTDDARHTLEVIKSACSFGAVALNYARVTGLVRRADGTVSGVTVQARQSDGSWSSPFDVYASRVVNATGVWTDQLSAAGGVKKNTHVVPAKGAHITVSQQTLPIKSAMIVPSVHDQRFCFAVPWYDSVVIGTTDTEYNGDLDNVRATSDEIQYMLDAVNALFPEVHLTADKITGSFAGLRPLVKDASKEKTADVSRHHTLEESSDGLISIAGGKLTTYRLMARDTVDLVVKRLSQRKCGFFAGSCRTDKIRLGGFAQKDDVDAITDGCLDDALALGLSEATAEYLPTVYGAQTLAVLKLVQADENLGELIAPNHPYIMAQVVFAVRNEAALTLDDVLSRRIRLSITDQQATAEASARVANLLAVHLGWDDARTAAELASFQQQLLG